MMQILVIGTGRKCVNVINKLNGLANVEICAIVGPEEGEGASLARQLDIPIVMKCSDYKQVVDLIINSDDQEIINGEKPNSIGNEKSIHKVNHISEEMKFLPPYQLLLEQFPVFFLTIDEQGYVETANTQAIQLAGGGEHLIGIEAETVFPGINFHDVLANRKRDLNGTWQLPSGEELIMAKIPLLDTQERLKGAATIGVKVHEVIRLAEKHADLQDLTIFFEGILSVLEEPFSIADHQGRTWYASDRCLQLFGENPGLMEQEQFIHKKVQLTRRPFYEKEPLMNTHKVRGLPLMLDGKLKGSIVVYQDDANRQLKEEVTRLNQLVRKLEAMHLLDDFSTNSPAMQLAVDQARLAVSTDQPVLIRGEEGTGKRLLAEAIHNESEYRFNSLMKLDCADQRMKLFVSGQLAELDFRGTVILENIDYLNRKNQVELLSYLEGLEKNGNETATCRIIILAPENFEQAVMEGHFKKELYSIFTRISIFLPPLRQRKKDIQQLADRFIRELNGKLGRRIDKLPSEVTNILEKQPFMKNIAELKNWIESAMLKADRLETNLKLEYFSTNLKPNDKNQPVNTDHNERGLPLQNALESFEKGYIQDIYRKSGYNKTKTAEALNISIRNLYYKMDKYHIDKNSMQDHAGE